MLRPSGVSSASEANWATSANSRSVTLPTGMKSTACRLPKVIVPVLSKSRTSTSPAASTARPDEAITLRLMRRSIPAIPIADNRAPIVVGIRHTSNAITVAMSRGDLRKLANGTRVTHTNRKTRVSTDNKAVRATSLGVFCRLALSTRAIMRSMNPSPGLAVTLATNQSESTRVPPVTALRSPPDSRITGALSPVTALSSTDATPSITSPSAGMMSPVSAT